MKSVFGQNYCNQIQKMSKKNRSASSATATNTCAWCGKHIPKDTEIFSLGAKTKAGVDLTPHAGGVFPLLLMKPRRTIMAIVPLHDSPAKKEGNDLLFALCSQSCGQALKQALQQQLDIIDRLIN